MKPTFIIKTLFLTFFFSVTFMALGQMQLGGPNPVIAGQNYTYGYLDDDYSVYTWAITNGTKISSSKTLLNANAGVYKYSVVISWNGAGTGEVDFKVGTSILGTQTVTICAATTPMPTSSFNVTNSCNSSTISYTASAPSNISWYWQTSPTGTDQTYGGTSYSVAASGTYYLRALSICGTWSAASSVSVNVYTPSSVGTLTDLNNYLYCSSGTASISLSSYTANSLQWQSSFSDDGTNYSAWSTFSTSLTSPQSFPVSIGPSGARYYSVKVIAQNGPCTAVSSTPVSLIVYQSSVAGTLSPSTSSFCDGGGTINLSLTGSVGSSFRYTSRYQDNGGAWSTWTACSNSVSVSSPSGVNRTYQFQAFAQNGTCAEAGSNIVTVLGSGPGSPGTLSPSVSSVCSSGSVTLSSTSIFGTAAQWQYSYSDNGGASYSSFTTFSSLMTTPPPFSVSSGNVDRLYKFQLAVQNGSCLWVNSNSVIVTVNSNYTGTPSTSLVEGYNSVSGSFSLSGYVGSFQKWMQSTDGGVTWANASGTNTSSTYSYSGVATNTKYRALINNGVCSGTQSSIIDLKVYPSPAITASSQVIPLGGSLQLQANSSYYSYQWTKDGADLPGATSSSYAVSQPGSYSLRVNGSATAASATSNVYIVYSLGYQPDNNFNMGVTTIIRKAGVNASTNLYTLQPSEYKQSIVYTDDLSRAVQSIAIGQSPLQNDVITPFSYDTLVPISYLAYASTSKSGLMRSNALIGSGGYTGSDQYAFYQQTNSKVAQSTAPYSKTIYESSPLRRLIEQGMPGTDWQTGTGGQLGAHTAKNEVQLNVANDVKIWTANGPGAYYPASSLLVTKSTDSDGKNTLLYIDKRGKTVLKRVQIDATVESVSLTYLETYYVYDNIGRLIFQIPPKAVVKLNTGAVWNQTFTDQWCFSYTFDFGGRLIIKKTPGTAPVYYAYDTLNRLALVQNGYMRNLSKWIFIKYDVKGRPVMQGFYKNATQVSRPSIQKLVGGLYAGSSPYYEDRGTALHGYTNQSFPTVNADNSALEIMSVNYYDNYDFDMSGADDFAYTAQGISGEGTQGNSFGLPTGSKRLILGATTWLYIYQFYDRFGRAIQVRSNNHLSSAIDNLSTVIYDFEGKVLQTKAYHNAGTNQTTVLRKMSYDHMGRLTKVYQNINGEANDQLVAQYNYNELGQLVEKNLHLLYDGADGQTGSTTADNLVQTQYNGESNLIARNSIVLSPNYLVTASNAPYRATITTVTQAQAEANGRYLQSIDYRYNIHGRLSSINNAQLSSDGNATNDDTNDYFGMELFYNTAGGMSNTPYFNGNISAVKWKNAGTAVGLTDQRSYKYTYDKSDKLLTASFQANTGSAWNKEANTLDENMTYDANGNILALTRSQNLRGLLGTTVTSTPQTIDNLTYSYTLGNQLSQVEDAGSVAGFSDGYHQAGEYAYDADGNLTSDQNKGINSILYNELGKPKQISFNNGNSVTYSYDAAGNKLTATSTTTTTTATDYVGGFIYNTIGGTRTLAFFSSPEGRVVKNGSNFEYQYAIADHQGNTRVLFTSAMPGAQSVTAGFETINQTTEASNFNNYQTGAHINTLATNANSGSNSLWLNGGYAGQVGVAKSYKVFPGDKLGIQAYAKYNASSGPSNLTGFAQALLTAFNLAPPAPGEVGTPSSAINTFGGLEAGGWGDGTTDSTDPRVFVSIVLFDKNYNFLDVTYAQLTSSGALMSANYTVKEAGYAYLYVSNENATLIDVYFDDVKMSYTPSNILQNNEYYPFGLQAANSWTRDNTTNNFLYNDGSELNAATSLYDLQYRNYDPTLGRMNQIDPVSSNYSSLSPYTYSFNNPVGFNDPTGADPNWGYYRYVMHSAKVDPNDDFVFRHTLGSMMGATDGYGSWSGAPSTDTPDGYYDASENIWIASNYGEMSNEQLISLARNGDAAAANEYAERHGATVIDHFVPYGVRVYVNGALVGETIDGYTGIDTEGNIVARFGADGLTQGGPEWIVSSMAKAFFSQQMSKYGDKITWQIKTMLSDGTTERLADGTIHITIGVGALVDPTHAYLTIGHELIHAEDYLNGNHDQWLQSIASKGLTDGLLDFGIQQVMEYHAYQWDANLEGQFKVNFGAQAEFKNVTNTLNDYGLMYLFSK